jgi:hypothetical protein
MNLIEMRMTLVDHSMPGQARQVTDSVSGLERAILETVLYSDLFDYALTLDEVTHYLIGVRASVEEVRARLARSIWLRDRVRVVDGHVIACGREALVQRRLDRRSTSDRLWLRTRRFVRILSALPFVRFVGVTGALAMDNCAAGDDIDVMIVTAPDRVWLTRALAIVLVRAGKLFGDTLCPNYLISEKALVLERQSLFVAHELMQMVPAFGCEVYARLLAANTWLPTYLPNACTVEHTAPAHHTGAMARTFKRVGEWLLSGAIGDRLEIWEMQRKFRKFQPQLGRPAGAAILDRDHVKGHFDDYGGPVMRLYAERLAQYEA